MTRSWRTAVLLVGALAACGAPGGPPASTPAPDAPLRYGPFAARYEMASRGRVEQQYAGGQASITDFHLRYHLGVAVAPAAEPPPSPLLMQATLVIDSVSVLEGSAMLLAPSDAKRVRGVTFSARMAPEGELSDFAGSDTSTALARQLGSRLREFFPRLPASGARPGMGWVDTTRATTTSAGIELAQTYVNRHEALGWVEHDGAEALLLRTVSEYTVTGSGMQSGQRLTVEGTGRRHADQYLAAGGRYLGMTAADTAHLTAMVDALALAIPITQTRADTLRLLP